MHRCQALGMQDELSLRMYISALTPIRSGCFCEPPADVDTACVKQELYLG